MNVLHDAWEKLLKERTMQPKDEKRKDAWRPKIHIAPPVGWLNDPNGLCQYKGVYHAFYQFSPFQAEGGLKFWGHCTSRDLLHWEYQGAPLKPDQKYDCHGVYSGSALVEEDVMYLFYTANVKHEGAYDYILKGRESNTVLAVSADGMLRYEKEEGIFWMEFTDNVLGAGRGIRGRNVRNVFKIRILVDVSCVEVFLNDGEDVFSTRFYPRAGQYEAAVMGTSVRGYYRHHAR